MRNPHLREDDLVFRDVHNWNTTTYRVVKIKDNGMVIVARIDTLSLFVEVEEYHESQLSLTSKSL